MNEDDEKFRLEEDEFAERLPPRVELPIEEETPLANGDGEAFEIPPRFRFEREFDASVPRVVPKEMFQGAHNIKRSLGSAALFVLGACLIVIGLSPLAAVGGIYVPVLSLFSLLGVVAILGAAWINFSSSRLRGPYRYVREGVPVACKIRSLVRESTGHGEKMRMMCYRAVFDWYDPDTKGFYRAQGTSPEYLPDVMAKMKSTYDPGDVVTGVYVPGELGKTPVLYGFLELREDLGIVEPPGSYRPSTGMVMFGVAALMAVLTLFGVCGYVALRYWPERFGWDELQRVGLFGGIVVGIPTAISNALVSEYQRRRELRKAKERVYKFGPPPHAREPRRSVAGVILGMLPSVVMWGLLSVPISWGLNAWWDTKPAKPRCVRITGETRQVERVMGLLPILANYRLQYERAEGAKPIRLLVTPAELDVVEKGPAVEEMGTGYFGWEWIRGVRGAKAGECGP